MTAQDLLAWGRVPGNRDVARLEARAKRAVPEEGVHGGTWFLRGSEATREEMLRALREARDLLLAGQAG
jgi:hypothetical protein